MKMLPFDKAIQVITCPPTGTTGGLHQLWCIELKKLFTAHATASVTAEDSRHGELAKARKASATITSQLLQFRASLEGFFLPSFHPAPTAVPAAPFPSHPCQAAAAAAAVSASSSCPCLGCCCCFFLEFPRTVLPRALPAATVLTWPHGDKRLCTHPSSSGSGVLTEKYSLYACSECQQPYMIVCGVWRFERTQRRSYYYLLLMLSAE